MHYDEFIATVRERGEYLDRAEAERVARAVLEVLAYRVPPGEAGDVAAQLPEPLGEVVRAAGRKEAEQFGVEEFYRRVADLTGGDQPAGRRNAHAVLGTVADQVTGGQLNQLLSVLPSGYAALFGKPELT